MEEFVESVCILRRVWNLAGTQRGARPFMSLILCKSETFVVVIKVHFVRKFKRIQNETPKSTFLPSGPFKCNRCLILFMGPWPVEWFITYFSCHWLIQNPLPTPPTTLGTCRWCLHGLLHTEPGGQDALLPRSHLPDLATCLQTASGANGTPSGRAAS